MIFSPFFVLNHAPIFVRIEQWQLNCTKFATSPLFGPSRSVEIWNSWTSSILKLELHQSFRIKRNFLLTKKFWYVPIKSWKIFNQNWIILLYLTFLACNGMSVLFSVSHGWDCHVENKRRGKLVLFIAGSYVFEKITPNSYFSFYHS